MSVLSAQAAGVRRRRRWLFRDLDVSVSPGDVVAIVGPPGSGRTTVLLALAQRFRLSAGRVDLTGTAALGYVPGVSEPESVLTVAEHVRERVLLTGRRPGGEVAWHGLDPGARGWELSPYERQVLGLVLARMAAPQVVAVDGVDEGLDAAERDALWRLIGDVSAQGVAVLVTAREVDEAQVSTVVRLGGSGRAAVGGVPDARAVGGPAADAAEGRKAEADQLQEAPVAEREAADERRVSEEREMTVGRGAMEERGTAVGRGATEERGTADGRGATEGRETADEAGAADEREADDDPGTKEERNAVDDSEQAEPQAKEPPATSLTHQDPKDVNGEMQERQEEQGGEQK